MDFKETGGEDDGLDSLAQDMLQWRAFVNKIMKLRSP
jgi:hypothetical protein